MKKIIHIAIFAMLSTAVVAQIDRSKRPEPGPAPEVKIGDYKSFELKNGLKVIVVEDHKLPRITYSLLVDRDPVLEGDKAGYVDIAGSLLRSGTTSKTKDELDEEIDFYGARISTNSQGVNASGLSKYSGELLELMADIVLNPAFPEDEFERIKKQTLSAIEAAKEDPSSMMSNMSSAVLYGKDHPYGEVETEETVNNIGLGDCKAYYEQYFRPNVSYLAIVGDVEYKKVKKMVKKAFKSWEKGEVSETEMPETGQAEGRVLSFVDRPSAVQSNIRLGNTIDLRPGDEDEISLRVANHMLGGSSSGRLFKNLREDKGYTYGSYSNYSTDRYVGSFLAGAETRNEVTDSAVAEMLKEIKAMRTEKADEKELEAAKKYLSGSFARSLESPSTLARFALRIERYDLPADYYKNYLAKLDKVTAGDVAEVSEKYMAHDNTNIMVVGKAKEIAGVMEERYGDITYYDAYGNKTEAPLDLPEGLTAEEVVNDFFEALGGEENLRNIQDLTMTYEGEIQGMTVKLKQVFKAPDKFYLLQQSPMGSEEVTINGEEVISTQNGQQRKLTEEQEEQMKGQYGDWLEELAFDEDVKLELDGIEKVDGKVAYVVLARHADDSEERYFYDRESGLRLRKSYAQQGPQGEVMTNEDIIEYKEVNGILLPEVYEMPAGPMKLRLELTESGVNSGVDESVFE